MHLFALCDQHAVFHALIRNQRNKIWKRYWRYGRNSDRVEFTLIRNRIQLFICNAVSFCYIGHFNECRNNIDMWKLIKRLGINPKVDVLTSFPDVDILNRHFVGSVTSNPTRDRPTIHVSPDNRFYFKHLDIGDVAQCN